MLQRTRWLACLAASISLLGCPSTDDDSAAASASTGSTAASSGNTTEASVDDSGTSAETDATGGSGGSSSGNATDSSGGSALPCNGRVDLCDRPYDAVVFAGTHNSHAAMDEGFPQINANQVRGIADQLDDGIRVMLIDIYPSDDDPSVVLMCHGPCLLASTPHLEGLGAIADFLRDNPREVVTIIYQDAVEVEAVEADFAATGADALTYAHPSGQPWPTLGEMIDADTRLVITAESGGPPPAWYHHVWDEAWDTPYGPMSVEGLSCDLNRGSADNDLFLMNHWVNTPLDLPSQDNAAEANATDVLLARAQECWRRWSHPPNFVVVDFYEQGDLFAVVDALNSM